MSPVIWAGISHVVVREAVLGTVLAGSLRFDMVAGPPFYCME